MPFTKITFLKNNNNLIHSNLSNYIHLFGRTSTCAVVTPNYRQAECPLFIYERELGQCLIPCLTVQAC